MDETFVLVLASGAVYRLRFTAGMVLPPWESVVLRSGALLHFYHVSARD